MLRVTLQSEGEERGLETGHNWISYGLPPMEMLLRPCGFDLQASSDNDCAVAYNYQYFLPPPPAPASTELKLEDLLGGDSGAHCSETLTVDGQDTSSVSTVLIQDLRAVDDSSSAPSTGLENTLVPPPQPPAAGHRTSVYRGVTRHRWTGRYEAHLWDNTCKREGQKRKGRQVYLGGYDREEKAARAYDLAALKYWGPTATTNFPVSCYSREIEEMKCMTKQEFIASIRRKSSGFSRGASIYRGVTRHHQHGRWQARIGRVAGNKDLYLGTFATEEEAAEAYDVAAIKFRGANAVTNFELSRYDVEAIANTELPIGASAKRIKQSLQSDQDQLPLDKSDKGQHLNFVPATLFHNLMQFHGPSGFSPCLSYCSFIENDFDECDQNNYLLAAKDQHKNQYHNQQDLGSGILQLTHLPSQ
ncbi:AP2-like ethylene-responsive transcription factor AIL7 isoform X2 [Musa acuminata AAA Group]|uniref:AP2-like ethylene-responsive transcription factor AIL7 n=1 Tax=Musa acuminata AAA Group TaxID=214697 RepID=UPI0008A0ED9E|nr:PREDICTED: AP2-like ethylene-responsive transcription factor AIL7 [Musa acuminata subsp. malaccensis]